MVGVGDRVFAKYLEWGYFEAEVIGFPDNSCKYKYNFKPFTGIEYISIYSAY